MGRWLIGCVDEERACEMKKKKKREEEGIESNCVREYNKNNNLQSYSNRVYMHGYCSKYGYMQRYTSTDVDGF